MAAARRPAAASSERESPRGPRVTTRWIATGGAIAMTTLAVFLALLPLALGIGEGSGMLRPLAIAIYTGLIAQLPLVLLVSRPESRYPFRRFFAPLWRYRSSKYFEYGCVAVPCQEHEVLGDTSTDFRDGPLVLPVLLRLLASPGAPPARRSPQPRSAQAQVAPLACLHCPARH